MKIFLFAFCIGFFVVMAFLMAGLRDWVLVALNVVFALAVFQEWYHEHR